MTVTPTPAPAPKKNFSVAALLTWAEAPATRKEVSALVAVITAIVGGLKGTGVV